jgi:flagellar hook-basal body complex protein FliE
MENINKLLGLKAYKPIEQIIKKEGPQVEGGQVAQKGASFNDMLGKAIKEVDALHHQADAKVEELVTGKNDNPHDAMIALEKADVAFQLMNQVRSKIIRAYEEIIRTQV